MAANKVFRSDDRGQSWTVISEDITTQTDRNTWPVMGRYWGVDAVAKDVSTSLFGTGVSLAESLIKEDLVFVGTDDGVIQVTEDAGKNWTKITSFPGVPEYTFVSDILPDRFDENIVYASFDNIQRDDFKPYLLKSTNKGKSWESISGNLPENHTVLTIAQDFVDPNLLFIGTEFGVFFTLDGGKIWIQLKSGLPTIKVPDIVIQERECDLVIATFGRGFYILGNYAPLRELSRENREKESYLFPVKDPLMFTLDGGLYGQGSNFFYAPNPAFGATFTYYLKEIPKTLKQIRKEKEKILADDKKPIPIPSTDELRAEENQVPPYLIFTIKDLKGNTVRKLSSNPSKGTARINWDLRYANNYNVDLKGEKFDPFSAGGSGVLAMPGKYSVSMAMVFNGEVKELAGPVEFEVKLLNNTTLPNPDRAELIAFQDKVSVLTNAVNAADEYAKEQMKRVQYVKQAIQNTPDAPFGLMDSAMVIQKKLDQILWALNGQVPMASDEENLPAPPPVKLRLDAIMSASYGNTSSPTKTQKDQYALLEEELPPLISQLKEIGLTDLVELEKELDKLGAPWTPGRVPEWKK
jgi:hypothetical protein